MPLYPKKVGCITRGPPKQTKIARLEAATRIFLALFPQISGLHSRTFCIVTVEIKLSNDLPEPMDPVSALGVAAAAAQFADMATGIFYSLYKYIRHVKQAPKLSEALRHD